MPPGEQQGGRISSVLPNVDAVFAEYRVQVRPDLLEVRSSAVVLDLVPHPVIKPPHG